MFTLPILLLLLSIICIIIGTYLFSDDFIGILMIIFGVIFMVGASILLVRVSTGAAIRETKQIVLEHMYHQNRVTLDVDNTNLVYMLTDSTAIDLFNYLTTEDKKEKE